MRLGPTRKLSRKATKLGPEGEVPEVGGNKSLCWRDCSKKKRGRILTGPEKAVGDAELVSAKGKTAMLQTKARARQLRANRLGRGYLNRNLSVFLLKEATKVQVLEPYTAV